MVLVTDTSEGGGVIGGRKLSNDCVGEVGVTTVGLDIIVVTVVWPLTVGVVVPVRFKVSLSPPTDTNVAALRESGPSFGGTYNW